MTFTRMKKYSQINKGGYMKKIIWVFGESATGKLTLINNV